MQGTLSEIDIRSILQLIELGQRTGELLVEAYPFHSAYRRDTAQSIVSRFSEENGAEALKQVWFVFFVNGQIVYAADCHNGSLSRLQDYVYRYKVTDLVDPLEEPSLARMNAPEYACLWQLLANNTLTPAQGRIILQSMIHETLFDLLSLHQGSFIFEMGSALAPQLLTLKIAPAIAKIVKQVQQWKQFYPHIQSPNQALVIADEARLRAALSDAAYESLSRWANGKTSLRQLSRYLNRNLVTLAKGIYPYAERGWIHLVDRLSASNPATASTDPDRTKSHSPHIVCIDDDLSIGKNVEYILTAQGYQLTLINDPLQALSLVFQIQPDLILCDIAMPKLDGYELCSMLRHSTLFRQTPIIMLTGKDAFIDRIRARMVGATDYLTKPFGEKELLLLLEKYTHETIDLKA